MIAKCSFPQTMTKRARATIKNDRVCRYFGTTEGCKYGDNCRFAHAIEVGSDLRCNLYSYNLMFLFQCPSSSQVLSSSQRNLSDAKTDNNNASMTLEKQTPCRFFLQGHCRNGNLCRRSHDSLEHMTVRIQFQSR